MRMRRAPLHIVLRSLAPPPGYYPHRGGNTEILYPLIVILSGRGIPMELAVGAPSVFKVNSPIFEFREGGIGGAITNFRRDGRRSRCVSWAKHSVAT